MRMLCPSLFSEELLASRGSMPCFEVCTHSQTFQSTDLAPILLVLTCSSYFTFMLMFAQAQPWFYPRILNSERKKQLWFFLKQGTDPHWPLTPMDPIKSGMLILYRPLLFYFIKRCIQFHLLFVIVHSDTHWSLLLAASWFGRVLAASWLRLGRFLDASWPLPHVIGGLYPENTEAACERLAPPSNACLRRNSHVNCWGYGAHHFSSLCTFPRLIFCVQL